MEVNKTIMRQELIDMLLEFYGEAINEKNKMNTTQQEYNKAIEIIERIEEKLDMMEKRLDEAIDKINNKSREAKQQSYIHVNEENKNYDKSIK